MLSESCLSKLQESRKLMLFDVLTMIEGGQRLRVHAQELCKDFGHNACESKFHLKPTNYPFSPRPRTATQAHLCVARALIDK